MRRLLTLILLMMITALCLAQTGRAQSEIQLGTLEINLWPEYDRPDMLVIYKITLQPGSVPADLTFRIPKEVSTAYMYKIATWAEDGNLYETPYQFHELDDWNEVSFQVNATEFQIEYYDPRLEKLGMSRSFEFSWPGDYAVNSAVIVVQQPLDANHMQFTPANVSSFKGDNDLTYYAHQMGMLRQGQTYNFLLSYQKPTNTLTYEKQKVGIAGALPQSMWNRGLPWALGLLALVMIVGGVWVYWRSGRPQAGQKKHKRRKPAAQVSGETTEDSGVYCHSCGRRASAGDIFCRSCGTKLRI